MRLLLQSSFIILFLLIIPSLAQTGKISGTITDTKTNDPLIGANVIILGTPMGAATNIDGYYSIINVAPGSYTLKASSIGYETHTIIDIRVSINQTTLVDMKLNEETIETEEVIVVAIKPVVQKDVSSSTVNLNAEDIENLPVVSVSNVITLQAGIQSGSSGITIRGGGSDQTAFMVNGVTLRDERDNTPYTGISFTSIEEIQVQTGGFNAEYGNIRSGLVNVVTKEGRKDKYTFSFLGRYRPAGPKHFGDPPNSPNSYWIRSYIDPAVAWTGTESGAWDDYTQRQYQEFRGWNKVSEELLNDSDPTNDLTPEAAQRLFLWQHRRVLSIERPDYDIDLSFTGPIPGGEVLGNLRFAFSYRTSRDMYFIPLSTDAYEDYNYQLKLTSDIQEGMKLSLEGLLGRQSGTNSSRSGGPGIFRSPTSIADDIDFRSAPASFLDARVFATDYWDPSRIKTNMLGAKFTHVLNPQTFYEVSVNRVAFDYSTNPVNPRYQPVLDAGGNIIGFTDVTDTSKGVFIGGHFYDMSPFGYYSGTSSGIGSSMNMGLGFSDSRDSSKLTTYTAKFDIASQIDKYNYAKAGVEFTLTDNNVNYALIEPSLPTSNAQSKWHTFPKRAAVYLQDKLEFEGMIANLGLRLDYSDPGGNWYILDPFDELLSGELSLGLDTLSARVEVDKQLYLSPRLGIAFPISVNSKLYFNYGHFRSMPIPEQLFLVRRSQVNNQVLRIADPNNPLPRTVAYELGYEHNLFEQLLVRVAGYYKDITDQPRLVRYQSRDNSVDYTIPEPNSYEDIRGFEITLTKNRGDWIRGFINYTYMVSTNGFFALPRYSENPAVQREIERTTSAFYQDKPVPQPYGRANIDLFTPLGFGPELGGIHILEDVVVNILASYSAGRYFSWTGPGATQPGFDNNIQWSDFYNVDLRISKGFIFGLIRFEFFMDIFNV
ncbi:MAG: carboxypeptidase-like regulatory domain-containing protein, partial [Ignavibacteria bacterium]|nr:carboxypeptidase-like regulatory domain-containing protein [Ignavibacteria bacterium]